MSKRFASFYRCLAFAGFWKVKFWRSFIKCRYFNDGWTDVHKNIYLDIFILGFFRKPEKLGSHTGSKWWLGDPDVKDDPNDTHLPGEWWPNDPVPCLAASTQPVQVPVPVLESQVPVWVPLLEIDITFLFKAAKVEVSKALLLKPDWIIIDKRSKPAHCYSSLHIRTVVTFNNNQFWEQCVWQSCTVWLQDDATLTKYTLYWSIWSWHT